ncbi:MAG: TIGR04282 family arsenosugar biosynthesis glycosyltransferase [Jatrophihabitans sp.]
MIRTVAVIAKQPVAGRVKTRLIGACSPVEAAELAGCALADTLAALAELPCQERVILLDGQPDGWLPDGWTVIAQVAGGLDERLSAGFDALPDGPALLVGMDTPQLHAGLLAFDPADFDACLGVATDGGYWAIGFADPRLARRCIQGVPMSTEHTGAEQYRRLVAAGLSVQLLAELTDVDTADDAEVVALAAPQTSFARRWQQISAMSR